MLPSLPASSRWLGFKGMMKQHVDEWNEVAVLWIGSGLGSVASSERWLRAGERRAFENILFPSL